MIKLTQGNLLQAEAEALVNTVNCVGYMGKGIALQFKKAFTENYEAYRKACQQKAVKPGHMFVYETGDMLHGKFIINFPTKRHWRHPSRMEDIESGLIALVAEVKKRSIKSIAIPPLGCGLGGLDWQAVKPKIEAAFAELPDVQVLLYEPKGAPEAQDQPIHTQKPELTRARALLILLIARYRQFDYRLTLLEIHKLAYLLQMQGEPLKLKYDGHHYGPYARNIRFLLQKLEGHYLSNLGDDESPEREVELLSGAVEEAETFIGSDKKALQRLEAVSEQISGFETPYGMELLTSVHWIIEQQKKASVEEILSSLQQWSPRKATLFKPFHVQVALQQLQG